MSLSAEAKEARRKYAKEWREKNKEHYNNYMKSWRNSNPDKIKQYQENFWNKQATEQTEAK